MRVSVDTSELVSTTHYGLPVSEWYSECVLVYVDNLLVASCIVYQLIQAISNTYQLKKGKKNGIPYGPPKIYLGAHIHRHWEQEDDPEFFWYDISCDYYVNNMVANAQKKSMYHGI